MGELVIEVAESEVAPGFRNLALSEIIGKPCETDPDDLVTAADRGAEAALTQPLLELVPGSCIVGEESTAANPERLRRLSDEAYVWVVDPLDGTKNFVNREGPFGTSVALLRNGQVLISAILNLERVRTNARVVAPLVSQVGLPERKI